MSAAVGEAIGAVLRDTGRPARALTPELVLAADLGLDSLDLAQTVVLLERALGVDPFRAPTDHARPAIRTVADLVNLYVAALP